MSRERSKRGGAEAAERSAEGGNCGAYSFKRREAKCGECPYKGLRPSQRSRDELAYARCTPPEDFLCHMEGYSGGYGCGDGETICRGRWEAYHAAVKKNIAADEGAGDRVHGFKSGEGKP